MHDHAEGQPESGGQQKECEMIFARPGSWYRVVAVSCARKISADFGPSSLRLQRIGSGCDGSNTLDTMQTWKMFVVRLWLRNCIRKVIWYCSNCERMLLLPASFQTTWCVDTLGLSPASNQVKHLRSRIPIKSHVFRMGKSQHKQSLNIIVIMINIRNHTLHTKWDPCTRIENKFARFVRCLWCVRATLTRVWSIKEWKVTASGR